MLTTLSRKMIMALTGAFLCLFLTIHFLGNLQLFMAPENARIQFNAYSHFFIEQPIDKAGLLCIVPEYYCPSDRLYPYHDKEQESWYHIPARSAQAGQ